MSDKQFSRSFLESLFILVTISDLLSTEMEITKIILAKVKRYCQLLSHKRGFQILDFKCIGLAYGFLSSAEMGGGVEFEIA